MTRSKTCAFAAIMAVSATLAVSAVPAFAGALASDTNALPAFHGSVGFSNTFGLVGTVEFAVYAPGNFPAGFLGFTPTPGDYVYAYQGFETGPADLSQISITLTVAAPPTIGDFTGTNGFGSVSGDPSISAFAVGFDSASWLFGGIGQGGSTDGLAFSSPYLPMLGTGRNVDDGTKAFYFPVPIPDPNHVPEPGTITLAACGFAVLILHRIKRRDRRSLRAKSLQL